MEKFAIKEIKSCLLKSLKNFEKKENFENKARYLIYPLDEEGTPGLILMNGGTKLRPITFGELVPKFDRAIFSGFGFEVERDLPGWIKKFLVYSKKDHKLDNISRAFYTITHFPNDKGKSELKAFMYVDNKQVKEVTIEYILTTE